MCSRFCSLLLDTLSMPLLFFSPPSGKYYDTPITLPLPWMENQKATLLDSVFHCPVGPKETSSIYLPFFSD